MHQGPGSFGRAPAAPHAPRAWPDDAYVSPGGRSGAGIVAQTGVVVLRPGRAAFVAIGEALTNGALAGRIALGATGFVSVGGRPRHGSSAERVALENVTAALSRLAPAALDAEVPRWVAHYGGAYLEPSTARLCRKKLFVGERIWLETADGARFDIGHVKRALAHPGFVRVVAAWSAP